MAPSTLLSAGTVNPGTVRPFCPTSSATKTWQVKRFISSGSAWSRHPPYANMEKVSSSIPVRPLDAVLTGRRRSGLRPETRSCTSRRVLTGAAAGSVKVEEPSSSPLEIIETSEEKSADSDETAVTPVAAKAERFKPRIPGQKARREDPTVPAEALVEGAVFTGKVTTIQSFGAFVNFGAFTDGLVHISKMSTGYVNNVSDIVTLGQEVKVTIISVEQTSGRIALSMVDKEEKEAKEAAAKAGEGKEGGERTRLNQGPDGRPVNRGRIAGRQNKRDEPQKPPTKLSKGQEVEGTVKNKIRSGIFVVLPEDEEGFLRYSDIPGGENMAPELSLQVGEKIKATVLRIDRGKIVLSMKPTVDIISVNRDINKGKDSDATNPFAIAFRAFNLIPSEPLSSVDEAAAADEVVAATDVAEEVPGTAATEESTAVGPDIETISPLVEDPASSDDEVSSNVIPDVAAAAVAETLTATEDVIPESASAPTIDEVAAKAPAFVESIITEATSTLVGEENPAATNEIIPDTGSAGEEFSAESVPETTAVVEESSPAEEEKEVVSDATPEVAEAPDAIEDVIPEAVSSSTVEEAAEEGTVAKALSSVESEISPPPEVESVASAPASVDAEISPPVEDDIVANTPASEEAEVSPPAEEDADADVPASIEAEISPLAEEEVVATSVEERITEATSTDLEDKIPSSEEHPASKEEEVVPQTVSAVDEFPVKSVPDTSAAVDEVPLAEDTAALEANSVVAAEAPAALENAAPEPERDPEVQEAAEKAPAGISAALVKQLRDETGAGMMDCKRALADALGDLEKARETLWKKGLSSAEKKASRIASEGLIGSYIHDSRIGVLVEVNCETDFVSRGPVFKSLVEDVALQVVAGQQVHFVSVEDIPTEVVNKEKEIEAQREDLINKPEAIRSKIVEGRVSKRLSESVLLDQPYIRDDKITVKDLVKQTVVTLGENIKVRRFERYILGEGLQKKGTDFAAEVAAQTSAKTPVESPVSKEAPVQEAPAQEPDTTEKVLVSPALVKELRGQTGAGMMDCKKALIACENDLEKAVDFLRKKGLASADKKASRIASEGLIGSYIHDGRIGILIEVNCETDFVARGEKFKELVEDLAMQAAAYPLVQVVSVDDVPADVVAKEKELESGKEDLASKPEAIRARIVDGRVAKRLSELSLLEQPFIKDDKKLVKDIVRETVAALGENIQVRRFTRFNLGEGIEKKVVDFASEVAAQSGRKA